MYGLHTRSLELSKKTKREFLDFTDDQDEAIEICETYWSQGEKNVTFAPVRQMLNPPETIHKFVILRITHD